MQNFIKKLNKSFYKYCMLDKNGRITGGELWFHGEDMAAYTTEEQWLKVRGKRIAMVFQDHMTSLNPVRTIGEQIAEVIVIMWHFGKTHDEAKAETVELLRKVGIPEPEKRYKQYPGEFSGGMRQRVVIATAIACRPEILICDEPTTALDVTVQAQVLDLIKSLQKELKMSVVFITHDLGVVANVADWVAVMYAGKIVEYGTVHEIFKSPEHPYTKALLRSLMHACGHDIHFAAALGLLLLLKPHENELDHAIKVFFQPAEETVGGANDMILHGCMKKTEVRKVFGFHIAPTGKVGTVSYITGAMNAAVTDFELTVRGRSCHGAHPDQGIDAIVAAAGIVSALQSVPARRFAPTTPTIVTIGTINGGTAGNIVAGEVKMTGTLCALDMGVMTDLKEIVRKACQEVAQGFGASAQINYTAEYPVLYNDSSLTECTIQKIEALLGKENVLKMDAPSLGADDFAFFCQHAPCFYFNVGCRGEDQGDEQVLHSSCLAPDEDSLRVALEILCNII